VLAHKIKAISTQSEESNVGLYSKVIFGCQLALIIAMTSTVIVLFLRHTYKCLHPGSKFSILILYQMSGLILIFLMLDSVRIFKKSQNKNTISR